jgi:hypothetical protein
VRRLRWIRAFAPAWSAAALVPLATVQASAAWVINPGFDSLITTETSEAAMVVECDAAVRKDGRSAYSLSLVIPTATYETLLAAVAPGMREAVEAAGVNVSIDHGDGPRASGAATVSASAVPGYSLLAVTGFEDIVQNTLFLTQLSRVISDEAGPIRVRMWTATGNGETAEQVWTFGDEGGQAAFAHLRDRCGRGFLR